ncbi:hypothetical protein [Streptomyces aurantiogriseus]|uniref:Uncharacterized protein n=1 Tax=Streptomyces aurantiogriseus TaxID=66870 RepID=A0A918C0Z5_9ACTN|nr:hypothetical protein [Streptomyces aurantiogriseus]GGR00137.1 hypothetical protein GCM10010251_14290 [Streptomyces aurantiogriseus]
MSRRVPAPASDPSPTAGCCLAALLVPVEIVCGYLIAAILVMSGRPTALLVWLGLMGLAALGSAVLLFRRGYPVTGAAQAVTAGLFLVFTAMVWAR